MLYILFYILSFKVGRTRRLFGFVTTISHIFYFSSSKEPCFSTFFLELLLFGKSFIHLKIVTLLLLWNIFYVYFSIFDLRR